MFCARGSFWVQSRKPACLPGKSVLRFKNGRPPAGAASRQHRHAKNPSPKPRPVRYPLGRCSGICVCVNGPRFFQVRPRIFTSSSTTYGRFGTAFAETDLDRANYNSTVADLMSGQHCDPLRVIMFNPETNRSEDVSHAMAQEILRRLGLEGRNVPSVLEDFIDRHVGPDRQLTLRLAS